MATTVKENTAEREEALSFIDGIQFFNTRSTVTKIVKDITKICQFLSIAVPAAFIAYYIYFVAISTGTDHRLITNCIMLALVAAELVINITVLLTDNRKKARKVKKLPKRIIYYTKFSIVFVTCGYAVYEALTHGGSIVKIAGTTIMLISLLARVLAELAKYIVIKYCHKLMTSLAMDCEPIAGNSAIRGIVKAGEVVAKPQYSLITAADKLVKKLVHKKEGTEEELSETEASSILDTVDELLESNRGTDEEREKIAKAAAEYKKTAILEGRAKKARKKTEEELAIEEAKSSLKANLKRLFGK